MDESEAPPEGGRRRAVEAVIGAAVLAMVLVGAWQVSERARRRPPELPPDLVHRASLGGRVPDDCLNCHARSGPHPQPPTHTGRTDCQNCHFLPER